MGLTGEAGRTDLETAEREIWNEAIKIYNCDDPKHRVSLVEVSQNRPAEASDSAEKLIEVAQDGCQRLRAIRNKSARQRVIASVLTEIRPYVPIFDVFTQGAPSPVAICWGTFRVLLEATWRCVNLGQELFDNVCAIARRVGTFRQQLRYLVINQQRRDALIQLYVILLKYSTAVIRSCQASRLRRSVSALSSKLPTMYSTFCSLAREVEAQVSAQSAQSVEALRTVESEHHERLLLNLNNSKKSLGHGIEFVRNHLVFRQDEEAQNRQLSKWLTTDLIAPDSPPAIADGTCAWIYQHQQYRWWTMSAHTTSALWIRGSPGSGKSSLSYAMARSAAESGQCVLHVSVLGAGTFTQTPASNLIVSLLAQISEHHVIRASAHFGKIRDILISVQAYGSRTAVATPTRTLIEKLQSISSLVPPLLLIVDGLDQLKNTADSAQEDSAHELAAVLYKIPRTSSVSLIVLSRPHDWICSNMDEVVELSITRDITNADIVTVVHKRVQLCPNLQGIQDEIIATIRAKGSGDFNYATMLLHQLQRCKSRGDQRRILKSSPFGLRALFDASSAKKDASLDERERMYRANILRLVAGAQRKLSPTQVNSALSLDLCGNSECQDERWFDAAGAISYLAEPFVVVSDDKVYFHHESAREYVLDCLVTTDDANSFLLNICLTKLIEEKYMDLSYSARVLEGNLLNSASKSVPTAPILTADPGLYDHATLHWHEYALHLQSLSPELWEKLRVFLFRIAFVPWAENLFVLLGRGGLDPHLQRLVAITEWYERLLDPSKPELPVKDLFLRPYEDVSVQLEGHNDRPELQFLPLIRMNGYLNNGGRTKEDFEKALQYAHRVEQGFTKYLGPRDRNTLAARSAYYQDILGLRRPDEALVGYQAVLKIQEEVLEEDDLGIFVTLQWIGICYQLLARFDESRDILEKAVAGFKRKQGEKSKPVLAISMGMANTLEMAGDIDEALMVYSDVYDKWVPVNGTANLFAAWILTSFGSTLRKQQQYDRAERLLFDAFATRQRLLTLENDTTVDSALHLALLYRQKGQRDRALAFLTEIEDSQAFKVTFERWCELEHIKALLAFDGGEYNEPRNALTRLIMLSTGENRDQNNRELLWVRLNLADAARDHGDEDSIPSLFAELVVAADAPLHYDYETTSDISGSSAPSSSSLGETVFLDTPRQLEIAEQALRLTRDKRWKDAQRLVENEGLRWVRDKDFWFLGGGPKVDTDTAKYRLPSLIRAQQKQVPRQRPTEGLMPPPDL